MKNHLIAIGAVLMSSAAPALAQVDEAFAVFLFDGPSNRPAGDIFNDIPAQNTLTAINNGFIDVSAFPAGSSISANPFTSVQIFTQNTTNAATGSVFDQTNSLVLDNNPGSIFGAPSDANGAVAQFNIGTFVEGIYTFEEIRFSAGTTDVEGAGFGAEDGFDVTFAFGSFSETFTVDANDDGGIIDISSIGSQIVTAGSPVVFEVSFANVDEPEFAVIDNIGFYGSFSPEVPEPSTYAAIFGGIALGLVVLRRRLRK
ncbi:MAG: PEP-CTERM sorting domain-containing protein [Opitutales bacterium]